ncbi:MAG: DinB family protein [Chloroflexota bacterium]
MQAFMTWVNSILTTMPARWQQLAESTPPELLALAPAEGEWSALECLYHMIDVEQLFQSRLRAFLSGQDFPAFNPATDGAPVDRARPAGEVAALFAGLRRQSLEMLAALTPADYDRRVRHAELGPVTLREMLHEWAGHDLNHTIQAEQALIQPFIQGCGPWVVYFHSQLVQKAA